MRITIKLKLIIGFLFAILSIFSIAIIGLTNLGEINNTLNHIVDISGQKVKLATRINQDILNTSRYVKDIILAKTQDEMVKDEKVIETIQKEMMGRIKALTQILTDKEVGEFNEFLTVWAAYLKQQQLIISLSRKNSNKKAAELSLNQARKHYDMASIQIKAIVDSQEAEQGKTVEKLQEIALRIQLAARINRNLVEIQRAEKNLILSTKKSEMEGYVQFSEAIQEDMLGRVEQLLELISAENKQRIILFKERLRQYLTLHQQITELTQENSNNNAVALTFGVARDQIQQATTIISQIAERSEENMRKEKSNSDEVYGDFRKTWITIVSVTLLMLGTLFYWIFFGISESINALQTLVNRLRQGNLTSIGTTLNADEIGEVYDNSIDMQVSLVNLSRVVDVIAEGNLTARVVLRSNKDSLALSINKMADNIAGMAKLNKQQQWFQQSLIELADIIQQSDDLQKLGATVIAQLCRSLDAKIGALYIFDTKNKEAQVFKLLSSYAFTKQENLTTDYKMGEGLVGQAALDQNSIVLQNAPDDYIKIESALGYTLPRNLIIVPVVLKGSTLGVIEMGFTKAITANQKDFIERSQKMLAIAFNTLKLNETQLSLAEELQIQQSEISEANEKLTIKTKALQKQSTELHKAKQVSEQRSVELEVSNKYKSEFLANMSHELRTPLNSLLILSGLLAKNKEGTLTEDQVDSAQIIQKSGRHLLQLINDILDLSKIEAGHIDLMVAPTKILLLSQSLQEFFAPLVNEKSLDFNVVMAKKLPDFLDTDAQKLEQILINLISNAIKFTQQGEIRLEISYLKEAELFPEQSNCVCFSVIDSGIGIAKDQQERIFSAFQQIDGSSRRKHGGTGLGLSIALAYTHKMGGHLKCQSKLGKGSQFDLYIPEVQPVKQITTRHIPAPITEHEHYTSIGNKPVSPVLFSDDREEKDKPVLEAKLLLELSNKTLLLVDDDMRNSLALKKVLKELGIIVTMVASGQAALDKLAEDNVFNWVIMDIMMPDMDGYEAIRRIRAQDQFKHLPLLAVTAKAMKGDNEKCLGAGASDYLSKPIDINKLTQLLHAWISK